LDSHLNREIRNHPWEMQNQNHTDNQPLKDKQQSKSQVYWFFLDFSIVLYSRA
jgi:hypothetical protein